LNKGIVTKTIEKITPEGKSAANLKIVSSGTFVMAITGLEAKGTRGNCAILGIDTTLNQSCMALFPDESKLIPKFLFQWYIKFGNEYGIRYTQGTKQQSYNAELIKILPINNPNIEEQEVLVSFLKKLDDIIQIKNQQLSLYESLKEYLLQRLFPLNEEHTPNVRFANFEDDWKLSKLGNYVDFINGRAYKQSELLDKGKYKVLRVGNFNTNPRWYYSNLDLDSNKYAKKGDLLYLWATNFGPKIWHEEKVIYHYHIWKLDLLKDTLDKIYLFYWLEVDKKRIGKDLNGTTMVHITKETMENRILNVPENIFEQKKLGILLNTVTNLIELYQKQLSSYESLKNYYLQKLFI